MNLFFYSDESGVFDPIHNDFFVFGGIVFTDRQAKENAERKYLAAEKAVRQREMIDSGSEVKASVISNGSKGKLFRSLNQYQKFGAVVNQKKIISEIAANKKSRQRYMDWVYKMAVKTKVCALHSQGIIDISEVTGLYIFVDEHSTATDGKYELAESIEQEFSIGSFGRNFTSFFPPVCPNLKTVKLEFCNSSSKTLVRAADIIANRLYFEAKRNNYLSLADDSFSLYVHPDDEPGQSR